MARGLKVGDFVIHDRVGDQFWGVISDVGKNGVVVVNSCEIKRSTTYINECWLKKLTTTDNKARAPYREGDVVRISDSDHPHFKKNVFVYQVIQGVNGHPTVLNGFITEMSSPDHVILLDSQVEPA